MQQEIAPVNSQDNLVGQAMPDNSMNSENQLSQNLPPQPNFDINTLTLLLGLLQQVNKEKGNNAKPDDFIKVIDDILKRESELTNEV